MTEIEFFGYREEIIVIAPPPVIAAPPVAPPPVPAAPAYSQPYYGGGCGFGYGAGFRKRRQAENGDLTEDERDLEMSSMKERLQNEIISD